MNIFVNLVECYFGIIPSLLCTERSTYPVDIYSPEVIEAMMFVHFITYLVGVVYCPLAERVTANTYKIWENDHPAETQYDIGENKAERLNDGLKQ